MTTTVQLPPTYEQAHPILEQFLQESASTAQRLAGGRQKRPYPPRDLQVTVGTLDVTVSWTKPPKYANIVGWRVYKDTETNLIDRIPDQNTLQAKIKLTLASATAFYVSAVNAIGQESIKVQVIGTPGGVTAQNVNYADGTPVENLKPAEIAAEKTTGKSLDILADGTTYGRPLGARLNAGKPWIDFSEAIHANKNVDNVADGSSRFAATSSVLSYRPLSNPLTATDAGANATVSVSAFTMRTSSKGDISIGSGSVTSLSYNTTYFIYYDDSSLAGGSVTFSATTTKETALNGSGRFYVGSITTPRSGAGSMVGNNDGGTGAQYGQVVILIPTAHSGTFTNPVNARDGDRTSTATTTVNASTTTGNWNTFPSFQPAPATSLILKIEHALTISIATVTLKVDYSLNDGSTFTNFVTTSSAFGKRIDSISLPVGTPPNRIQCRVTVDGTTGVGNGTHTIYEVWIEETF